MNDQPELSIVIPVYDEEENVPILHSEITAAMRDRPESYEVLYVDDGSKDGSLEALRRVAAEDPRVRIIRMTRNSGQSAALAAGFRRARGVLTATLDADLQNDPADIPKLLDAIGDHDVISGVRATRRDNWLRRLSSRIANGVRSRVLGDAVHDVGCSLKIYRTELLREVPPFNGMHRFLPALVQMYGAKVVEMPVNHRPRVHGQAKYGLHNRLWRGIADLFGVLWLRRRHVDLRVAVEEPSNPRPT